MNLTAGPGAARLRDRVILVTGSGTGIGEGMARRFVSEGVVVMIHDREPDAARVVASDLGDLPSFLVGNLKKADVPKKLVKETVAHFGRIDALVNNAAVKTRGGIEDT